MRLCVLVEGASSERQVYAAWLAIAFPAMKPVGAVHLVDHSHYAMISGDGYPQYKVRLLEVLDDAVAHGAIDRLIVAVDAEDQTVDEVRAEIGDVLAQRPSRPATTVVIQNRCLETWLLGNRDVLRRHEPGVHLDHIAFYDVSVDDPELMDKPLSWSRTAARYHARYLADVLKACHCSYSKARPGDVCRAHYLRALRERCDATAHLRSLAAFLALLEELGGALP
ncbi:MAG: hypothetical protein HZB16_17760 [Armatimonadetes bacterium]|nr:hypothetical protein [Armatimonadota bacterium]